VGEFNGPKETLAPGQDNLNIQDNANCPSGWVVVGTGFDDGAVMTVGFVDSFHYFVDGYIYNNSNVSSQYQWQAICAQSSSASAAAVSQGHQQEHQMKLAGHRQLQR
jgi:hypothetical protein